MPSPPPAPADLRAAPLAALDAEKPYPGLHAFEERDAAFFFGRERELGELFGLVKEQRLTVVYGKSGLGKTSILQAGLFPRLRAGGFFPVRVRFDFEASTGAGPGDAAPFVKQVRDRIVEAIRESHLDAEEPDDRPLWEYFSLNGFWDAAGRPVVPVLVMDQFEEVFTLGQARRRELDDLFIELADLIENRIPEALRIEAEQKGESVAFSREPPRARVVLSLREDFLAELEAYQRALPSLAKGRFRLGPLRGAQAVDAVRRPAPHLVDHEVAEEIVRVVAGVPPETAVDHLEVESSLLALYCRQLNERRGGGKRIDATLLLSSAQTILDEFYVSSITEVPPPLVRLIEEELLSASDRRETRSLELFKTKGDYEAPIYALVNRRLLRLEPRLGGQLYVELIHDKLTSTVAKHRAVRRAEEQRALETQREHEAQKRREEALQREKDEAESEARAAREENLRLGKEHAESALRSAKKQRLYATAITTIFAVVIGTALLIFARATQQGEDERDEQDLRDRMGRAEVDAEQSRRFATNRQWADAARSLVSAWSTVQRVQARWQEIVERRKRFMSLILFLNPLKEPPPPSELLRILSARAQSAMAGGSLIYADPGGVGPFAVSSDGRRAAVVGSDGRSVRILDLGAPGSEAIAAESPSHDPTPQGASAPLRAGEVESIQWFEGAVQELSMSGDGTRIFGRGEHGQFAVWSAQGKRLFGLRCAFDVPALDLDRAGRVALLRDASDPQKDPLIVRLGDSGVESALSLRGVRPEAPLEKKAPEGLPFRWILLAMEPGGSAAVGLRLDAGIAKGEEPGVKWVLWPAASGGEPRVMALRAPNGAPLSHADAAALGQRTALLATYNESAGLQLWDTTRGAPVPRGAPGRSSLESVQQLQLADDDRTLLAVDGAAVEVFDVQDPAAPRSLFVASLGSPPRSLGVVHAPGGGLDLTAITWFPAELHPGTGGWPVVIPLLGVEGSLLDVRAQVRPSAREALFNAADGLRRLPIEAPERGDHMVWAGVAARASDAERAYHDSEIRSLDRVESDGDHVALLGGGSVWILQGLRASLSEIAPASPGASERSLSARRWRLPKPIHLDDFAFAGSRAAAFDEDGYVELGVPASGLDATGKLERIAVPGLARALYRGSSTLDVSLDGRWAVGGGWGSEVYAWDIDKAKEVFVADIRRDNSAARPELPSVKVTALAALSESSSDELRPAPAAIVGDSAGHVRVFRTGKAGSDSAAGVVYSTMLRDEKTASAGHDGPVRVLAVADGQTFASGADDGTVVLWTIRGHRRSQLLLAEPLRGSPHAGGVSALGFSADRGLLISGGRDRTARVWDIRGGKAGCEMQEHADAIVAIFADPDLDTDHHQYVLSRDASGLAILWDALSDAKTCTALRRFRGLLHAGFVGRRKDVPADRRRIITVAAGGDVTLIEGEEEAERDRVLRGAIVRGAVLGDRLIASDDEGGLFSLAITSADKPRFIDKPVRVAAHATSKDLWIGLDARGHWITVAAGSGASAKGALDPMPEGAMIAAAALSEDGSRLVTVDLAPSEGKVRLAARLFERAAPGWKKTQSFELDDSALKAGAKCRGMVTGSSPLLAAGLHGSTPRAVAVDQRGCVRVWDGADRTILDQIQVPEGRLSAIALSPDGETLALGDADGTVRFMSFLDEERKKAEMRFLGLESRHHSLAVRALAFHPKGRFVVSGGAEGQAWLWDAQEGKALSALGVHPGAVLWATFRQGDGNEALTGGAQGWVYAWSTRTDVQDPEGFRQRICNWLPAGDSACRATSASPAASPSEEAAP